MSEPKRFRTDWQFPVGAGVARLIVEGEGDRITTDDLSAIREFLNLAMNNIDRAEAPMREAYMERMFSQEPPNTTEPPAAEKGSQ